MCIRDRHEAVACRIRPSIQALGHIWTGREGDRTDTPVSYTHLDVYKRQYQGYMKRGTSLLVLFMLIIMLGTLLNMVPVALFSLVVWMYSVSYTHLAAGIHSADRPV